MKARYGDAFAVRIDGESMSPEIRHGDLVVLKCYRRAPALVVPMLWSGRMMAAYEAAVLRRVQDVPGVPRLRGRYGSTGLVRDYVPGTPLGSGLIYVQLVDSESC